MKIDTGGNLTKAGWPRPIANGLPVPWVSPDDDLSAMSYARAAACASGAVCAVCGEGYQDDEEVYALVKSKHVPKDMSAVQAMDNGILHLRCLLLAVKNCPKLRQLKQDNELRVVRSKAHRGRVIVVEGDLRAHLDAEDCEILEPDWISKNARA